MCVCCRWRARAQVITKLKGDLKTVAERNARLLRKMTEMQLLLTNASRQGLVTPKVCTGRQLLICRGDLACAAAAPVTHAYPAARVWGRGPM
eukprot:COSAG01_NODE_4251_length_5207_cov_2.521339_13_plen_92_part_00